MEPVGACAPRIFRYLGKLLFVLLGTVQASATTSPQVTKHFTEQIQGSSSASGNLSKQEQDIKKEEEERIYLLSLKVMENFGCSDFTEKGLAALVEYLSGQAEFPIRQRTRTFFTEDEYARKLTGHFRLINYTEKTDTPESKVLKVRSDYSTAFRELSKVMNEELFKSYGNDKDFRIIADDLSNPNSRFGSVIKPRLIEALNKLSKFSGVDYLNVGCRIQGEPAGRKKNKLAVELNESDSKGKPITVHLDAYLKRDKVKKEDVVDSSVLAPKAPITPSKPAPVAPAKPVSVTPSKPAPVAPVAPPAAPIKTEPVTPKKKQEEPAVIIPPKKKEPPASAGHGVAPSKPVPAPTTPAPPAAVAPKAKPTQPPAGSSGTTTPSKEPATTGSKITTDRFVDARYLEKQFAAAKENFGHTSVLIGKAELIISEARKNGIDPVFMAAIISFETGWGTSYKIRNKNNPGGLTKSGGGYASFSSVDEGIKEMAKYLKRRFVDRSITTVSGTAKVYAPVGASNDPNGTNGLWPGTVVDIMNRIMRGSTALIGK